MDFLADPDAAPRSATNQRAPRRGAADRAAALSAARGGVSGATLVHAVVASLLLAAAGGAWVAVERASALRALAWFGGGAAIYLAMLRLAWNGRGWRRTALVLAATGGALAAYVILQYRHLGYPDKLDAVRGLGAMTSALLPAMSDWTPFPNSVATFLEGLLPLALGLALGRRLQRAGRVSAAILLATIALGLVLTASRGAWIASAGALALWPLIIRAGARRHALTAIAAAIAAGLVAASGWALFARPDRLDLYRHSLSLVRDFPFTGIGLGDQFAAVLSQHALLIQVPFLTYSHNLFLDLWLELGLPGAVTWVALVAVLLAVAVAGERAELGSGFRGACLGLLAIVIHGLSDARQSVDAWTWLPFFALLGLIAARLRRVRVTVPRAGVAWVAAAPAALLAVVVLFLWPLDAAWHTDLGGLDEVYARNGAVREDSRAAAVAAARTEYLGALRLDERQPTAHRRLGILAMADARFADALAHLEAAAAADPGNWTTRKALGLACTWTGDIERASRVLASLDDPTMPGELNAWSSWRESRGELSLAQRAAQVSLRLRPDASVLRRLASLERPR
jgi:O-antigen ligase